MKQDLTYCFDTGDVIKYKNNVVHCSYGPAITTNQGYKLWFVDGKLHRLDGPAYEGPSNIKEYWIDGVQLTQQDFEKQTNKHIGD